MEKNKNKKHETPIRRKVSLAHISFTVQRSVQAEIHYFPPKTCATQLKKSEVLVRANEIGMQ